MQQYSSVPAALTEKPNWVVWGVPNEPTKAPFQPEPLLRLKAMPAKSGVAATWGSFESAKRCVELGLACGIGYEFDGSGIYGVDLDHVIENGATKPEALDIVQALDSYTEISPSGHGLHIFVLAEDANITHHRRQGGFVEIYNTARYFTVTGNALTGYECIAEQSAELQWVHDKHLLVDRVQGIVESKCVGDADGISNVLREAQYNPYTLSTIHYALSKDSVLRACWQGERRCGDESASDQALMNKLAYWCNANIPAMLAAFTQSPYYAQKDEAHKKKCLRADYLPNTAKAACATLRSTAERDSARFKHTKTRDDVR